MINVHINDFRALVSQIGDIQAANAMNPNGADPQISQICARAHNTIQRTMGHHARLIYAPDDGSEYDPRN